MLTDSITKPKYPFFGSEAPPFIERYTSSTLTFDPEKWCSPPSESWGEKYRQLVWSSVGPSHSLPRSLPLRGRRSLNNNSAQGPPERAKQDSFTHTKTHKLIPVVYLTDPFTDLASDRPRARVTRAQTLPLLPTPKDLLRPISVSRQTLGSHPPFLLTFVSPTDQNPGILKVFVVEDPPMVATRVYFHTRALYVQCDMLLLTQHRRETNVEQLLPRLR